MSRILTSIVFISSALIAGIASADNSDTQKQASTAVQATTQTATPAATLAPAHTSAQTEIKLDEKAVPLFPANDKKEAVAPVAASAHNSTVRSASEPAKASEPVKAAETIKPAAATTVTATPASTPASASATAVQAQAQVQSQAANIQTDATTGTTATIATSNTNNTTEAAAADLKLVEFVLANQIVSREPKDVVESFSEGTDRGFAFARIQSQKNNEITFLWTRNGHECARITSPVNKAKNWRTFSSVKLKAGEWKVQLLDKDKVVLAEKSFTVK